MPKQTLTYSKSLEELEGILAAIEQDERLDIDELSSKVERAAELIKLLRERLKGTELRVSKVVESLREEETSLAAAAIDSDRGNAAGSASADAPVDSAADEGMKGEADDDEDEVPF